MSHYQHHVFFCTNQREKGCESCENHAASEMRTYAKKRIKALNEQVQGRIRINTAGCLNRCEYGPVLVIYPEAVWYSWVDQTDIDEIIDSHLLKGNIVERLLIDGDGI